ncbi:MAG: hypothetical protein E7358_04750 [Clostridiales bacterium]|nr:hypothetical protein [Clostridiales bacterium]
MNNDKYYEFNIAPKNESSELIIKNVLMVLKCCFFALTIFFLIIALFVNFSWFIFLFCLIVTLILLFFQRRFYNFYDIIFIDGFLSVVKVINNKKRKTLYRFDVKKINKIGFVGGSIYNANINDKNVKKIFTVNTESIDDVCIHVKDTSETLILLPYDERLFYCLIRFLGNSKLEKEFIDRIKAQ